MADLGKLAYWWMKVPGLNHFLLERMSQKQMAQQRDVIDINSTFLLFSPNSSGSYQERSALTKDCINNTLPALANMARKTSASMTEIIDIRDIVQDNHSNTVCDNLSALLIKHGSDKSGDHDYYKLYGKILSSLAQCRSILEIGMGTNNLDVVSNMGAVGKPGASLRAFRDLMPSVDVYGADVDTRILFQEDRIQTFHVDQLNIASLEILKTELPHEIDLIIDDGLHSPDANINTLVFALDKVAPGGWVVIEDIRPEAAPVWEVTSGLLTNIYQSYLIHAKGGLLFAVQKQANNKEFTQLAKS
jgi:hypothetical protein